MKRLAWLAGTALVVLLIAGGVLLLVGNLYVQSPAMQAKIRRELSVHLKMPAEARKTTLTPWDGLRIDGVTAPVAAGTNPSTGGTGETATAASSSSAAGRTEDPDPAARLLRLNARSFRARLAFGPLFQRREIVVREILFDTPDLSWAQTPEGRWRWPRGDALRLAAAQEKQLRAAELAEGRGSSASPLPSPGPGTPGTSESPTASKNGDTGSADSPAANPRASATTGGGKPTLATAPVNVAIEGFRVRHGVAQFLDTRGEPYGHFDDINLDGRIDAPATATTAAGDVGGKDKIAAESAHGRLWFARSTLRDLPTITKFESAFAYTPETLDVTDGHGELAGGVARVEYHLRHAEPGSPFQLRGKIEKVALGQLSKEIPAGAPRFLSGLLDGEVEMSGLSNSTASRTGRGQFRVADAQLQNLPLLQTLGDYLRIPELSQLKLKTAQADCRLEGETLRIDPLVLGAGALRIEARGTCGLTGDQPLDLQTRLIIDRATSRGLSQFVDDIFTALADSTAGERYIDFRISGPLANPKTDLLDRAVKSVKPLQDMIQTYVGGGGKKNSKGGATPPAGSGNNNSNSSNNNSGNKAGRGGNKENPTPPPATAPPPPPPPATTASPSRGAAPTPPPTSAGARPAAPGASSPASGNPSPASGSGNPGRGGAG